MNINNNLTKINISSFNTAKVTNISQTIEELKADVAEYVSFYNDFRVHERLGNKTPSQVERDYFSRV